MTEKLDTFYEKVAEPEEEKVVRVEGLSFTTRSSKNVDGYKANSVQKDTMLQLKEEGESIRAGQKIQYVMGLTNSSSFK